MVKVAPSVLSANFYELQKEIKSMESIQADWIHYDVMDGHFVPNISFGYSILNDISKNTNLFLDVHLMITHPKKYVDEFIKANASLITFHIEALENEEKTFELIKHIKESNVLVGISIKPNTKVEEIIKYLDAIDLVLVMSVEPGFGGQSFIESSLDKIKQLNELKKNYQFLIEVDGGINDVTGRQCVNAGADVLVAGSYIFKAQDRKKAIDLLR